MSLRSQSRRSVTPIAAVDPLDALVCEQDLKRSTVVFHHSERLVCQVVDASQGKIVVAPARCDDGDSLLPAETAHQLAGHGLAEQAALHFLAADGVQELVLLFGLDPPASVRTPMAFAMRTVDSMMVRDFSLLLDRKLMSIFISSKV